MKVSVEINGKHYAVDHTPIEISIGMHFDGEQPNTYGVPKASAQPYKGDGWVGDTRQGGSCNFETYTLTPHCNGTHTEGVGHIAKARIPITDQLKDVLIPATVVSIEVTEESEEKYEPVLESADRVVTRKALEAALKNVPAQFLSALVLRTLPNPTTKRNDNYQNQEPPFFTNEAMQFLVDTGVNHLMVDFPSVDRMHDEGKLSNHHIYWGVEQGSSEVDPSTASVKTITEFIFVPDEVKDGQYLLNLQIAPFVSDAAPSRPVLFSITAQ